MEQIKYNLETVTTSFCQDARQKRAELRPASFKGLLRYWYRASIAETRLIKLHKRENQLLGSTEEAASFAIKINDINQINNKRQYQTRECPVPHWENKKNKNSFKSKGLKEGVVFDLELSFRNKISKQKMKQIKAAFEISLLLGGVGQRSRRGFGSIHATNWKFNTKRDFLGTVVNKLSILKDRNYQIKDSYLTVKENREYNYPVIKDVFVGTQGSKEGLLKKIGQASSNNAKWDSSGYKDRMASPAYVSIKEIGGNFYPIITKLEVAEDDKVNTNVLKDFIDELRCKNGED